MSCWGCSVVLVCFFFPEFLCEIPGPGNIVSHARAKLSFVCAGFIK